MGKKKKAPEKSGLIPGTPEQAPEETLLDFARTLKKLPDAVKCLREAIIKTVANCALEEVFEKAISGDLRHLG
jgi:pyridoxine 5'-phosphate synthase PdxJ